MAYYMIHTMPKRLWYVEGYLLPSLLKQGIPRDHIQVYNDENCEGNLTSCIKSFLKYEGVAGGTWHLQDDVLISKNFKQKTEELEGDMIVCGFSSKYDSDKPAGVVGIENLWYSFPCIFIPNDYAVGCSKWIKTYIIGNPVYVDWWKKERYDDLFFWNYMKQEHKDVRILNLDPNIVEHVDSMLGGSVTQEVQRKEIVRSRNFPDQDLVEELRLKLRRRTDVRQDSVR